MYPEHPDFPWLIRRSTAVDVQADRGQAISRYVRATARCAGSECQAWGGARALKRRWSSEAGSTAANDHDKSCVKEFGGATAGDVGMTSVLAKLMLAQIAQKSSARPVGCLSDEGTVRLAEPASAAAVQATG
jgi:hypothetical protein